MKGAKIILLILLCVGCFISGYLICSLEKEGTAVPVGRGDYTLSFWLSPTYKWTNIAVAKKDSSLHLYINGDAWWSPDILDEITLTAVSTNINLGN